MGKQLAQIEVLSHTHKPNMDTQESLTNCFNTDSQTWEVPL